MKKRSVPDSFGGPTQPRTWLEFPGLLEEALCREIGHALRDAGVAFRVEQMRSEASVYAEVDRFHCALFVRTDHARAACRVLARAFELTDPSQDASWTGACPGCGCELDRAERCPSCGLNFLGGGAADDPRVDFVRKHGGFDET